ncbi:MAG TPA: hypothetical protein VF534_01665 [Paraburkholderia sp.]
MRIEIIDREHWLERVNAAINRIETERKKRDMEYVDEWRASVFGGRLWTMIFPDAKPHHEPGYPSVYGWDAYGTLLDMRTGLLSMGTGRIWFGETEINAAPQISQKMRSIEQTFLSHTHC